MERAEAFVGVEDAGAELEAIEVAGADEDGAGDDGRYVEDVVDAVGVEGGQVFTGDAVVLREDEWGGEVGDVAVVNIVGAQIGSCGDELLGPVGVGIGEIRLRRRRGRRRRRTEAGRGGRRC